MEQAQHGAWATLPLAVAILFAAWKRQILPALFVGVLSGAVILSNGNPLGAFVDTLAINIPTKALGDCGNVWIIVFCVSIGGLLALIRKLGGTRAIGECLLRRAMTVESRQLASALMGVAIFFDDYACCVIAGKAFRPVTDSQRIAPERLAYVVDATWAPGSSLAPVSTWVGMQIGLIGAQWKGHNAPSALISSSPYLFYSLFSLAFIFITVVMQRNFGPMLVAEWRARGRAAGERPAFPAGAHHAEPAAAEGGTVWALVFPIGAFVAVLLVGLWLNGHNPSLSAGDAMAGAEPSVVVLWCSFRRPPWLWRWGFRAAAWISRWRSRPG